MARSADGGSATYVPDLQRRWDPLRIWLLRKQENPSLPTWFETHQPADRNWFDKYCSSYETAVQDQLRFFFVAFENLQLLESTHKMAPRQPIGITWYPTWRGYRRQMLFAADGRKNPNL